MKFSVDNLSFSYKRDKIVFRDISFETGNGEIVALLGANGSGKTTLIKCMLGFNRPLNGEIKLDGVGISDMPNKEFWQKVGYVPQAKGTYSSLDVRNMILLGCASKIGVFASPSREDIELCESLADKLEISHLLDRKCSEISGGELQMVLIARSLITEPQILFFDEPESNLDFKNQLIVLETLSSLRDEGKCIILSTHYPEHALTRADKSLLFTDRTALFGNTEEILTSDNIRRAFGVESVITGYQNGDREYRSIIPLNICK